MMVIEWVSINGGIPKSSILLGFSLINHPFWGSPIDGNLHMWRVVMGLGITMDYYEA